MKTMLVETLILNFFNPRVKFFATFLLIFITTISCNSPTSFKKDRMDLEKVNIISGYGYIKKSIKDSIHRFQNTNLNIDFIFDNEHKSLIRQDKNSNSNDITYTVRYSNHKLTGRDQINYMPEKILDFELQGVYENSNVSEDDSDIFGFYFNPKTKDIIQITHMYFIGNPQSVFVFSNGKTNCFKDNYSLIKQLLFLDKPLQTADTVSVKLNLNIK
ncbi:hypothetical protein [Solitalea lacus]|uniref:hypothetical protein n=1 Tax=Solitalea lacus TaxID=2911172 RepID=UPI001EDA115C|nr:hypothetical protein [Solitalea lacus]UKJ06217.1 hypothetical protein L2B55_11785 [Solitalea lacus]